MSDVEEYSDYLLSRSINDGRLVSRDWAIANGQTRQWELTAIEGADAWDWAKRRYDAAQANDPSAGRTQCRCYAGNFRSEINGQWLESDVDTKPSDD